MADAWGRGPSDPPLDDWHAALADALRANGFDPTPPPLADDAEPVAAPAAERDIPADTAANAWWADGDSVPPPTPRASTLPAVAPAAIVAATPAGMPPAQAPRPPVTAAPAASPAPPAFLAGRLAQRSQVAGAAPAVAAQPVVEPVTPPVVPEPVAVEPVAVEPVTPPVVPEPVAVEPVPVEPVVPESAAVEAPVEPEIPAPALPAGHDPRALLAWPEPRPIDDERWPTAPRAPVAEPEVVAPVAGFAFAEAPVAPAPAPDPEAVLPPVPETPPAVDPWAGVAFSAGEDPAASEAAAAVEGGAEREIAETAWGPAPVFDSTEPAPWDLGSEPWVDPLEVAAPADTGSAAADGWDLGPAVLAEEPVADPWADAPYDAADAADLAAVAAPGEDLPAAAEADAGAATDERAWPPAGSSAWASETATLEPSEPEVPVVLGEDLSVELDPARVELLDYAEPAAPAAPSAVPAPAFPAPAGPAPAVTPSGPTLEPPRGTILDIGRRPPGARPVDPSQLPSRLAPAPAVAPVAAEAAWVAGPDGVALPPAAAQPLPAAPAAPATPVAAAPVVAAAPAAAAPAAAPPALVATPPGAVGADFWDLVTTAPAVDAEPKGSRIVTLFLTIVVLLVIAALVLGFGYMFTDLL